MTTTTRYIVMTAAAKVSGAAKKGNYKRIAVVQAEGDTVPAMISERAKGLVRIVQTWERLSVGKTARCAYAVALVEANALAASMTADSEPSYPSEIDRKRIAIADAVAAGMMTADDAKRELSHLASARVG